MQSTTISWGHVFAAIFIVASGVATGRAGAQSLGTFRWQLQPFCNVVTVTGTQQGSNYTLDGYDETGLQVLMGWQRTWDSGFSVVAAAGPVRLFGAQEDEWGSSETVSFNGYFRIGYGF